MTAGYIYRTTNRLNGKVYVGKHRRPGFNRRYIGSGVHFLRAVKHHGRKNFEVECLEFCETPESLDLAEQRQIVIHRSHYGPPNCYNITNGGDGGNGWKMPADEKAKRSARMTGSGNVMFGVSLKGPLNPNFGKHHSEEARKKIGERTRTNNGSAKASREGRHWCTGKKWSPELREKLKDRPNGMKGRHHSDSAKAKLAAVQTGRKCSEAAREKNKLSQIARWAALTPTQLEAVREERRQRLIKNPALKLKFRCPKKKLRGQQELNLWT